MIYITFCPTHQPSKIESSCAFSYQAYHHISCIADAFRYTLSKQGTYVSTLRVHMYPRCTSFKAIQVQNTKKLQWQLLSILSTDIFGQKILLLSNICRKQALISIENGVQCRNTILQSYIIIKQMEQFPILPGILYLQELLCVQIHSIQGEL